jgi:hypothetical protein
VDRNRHLGSTPSFDPGPLFLDRDSIIADRSCGSIIADHRRSIIVNQMADRSLYGLLDFWIVERIVHRGSTIVDQIVFALVWVHGSLKSDACAVHPQPREFVTHGREGSRCVPA